MDIQKNIPLAQFSSYRIGGRARYFFDARTLTEVKEIGHYAEDKKLPLFVLGGGTNLLIGDEGFEGVVVKPNFKTIKIDENTVQVGAGVLVSDLLDFLATKGFSGLEWAGGLPGTVGGAVRGNAGAFGGEIKDSVLEVESFDIKRGRVCKRTNADCDFGYRTSIFKEGRGNEIILFVSFGFVPENSYKIKRAIQEKIEYRKSRHPMEYPNVGSIFKNVPLKSVCSEGTKKYADSVGTSVYKLGNVLAPVKVDPFPVIPTAYLISEAGLKGVSFGGAMISPKHPNFIVNVLAAEASDVIKLIALIKAEVGKKFDVELEEEVERLGV